MSFVRSWLPRPFLSLVLLIVWLLMNNAFSLGQILLGLILAMGIPLLTEPLQTQQMAVKRPLKLIKYIMVLMWDIVVANIQVAWIVLTKRNADMRPNWVVIPLDLRSPEAITILAGTITLTPGTVSADLSDEGKSLLVHALDADDPDAVRDDIKQRYERRIKEIFE